MSLALAALLGLAALGLTLQPLFRRDEEPVPEPEGAFGARELQARRAIAFENVRDLDFEHAMGKLTDADYAEIRGALLQDAAVASRDAEASGRDAALDRWIEAEVRARRGGGAAGAGPGAPVGPAVTPVTGATAACGGCGAVNAAASRFCDRCGLRLAPADCGRCGVEQRPGAQFCAACGSRL